MRDKIQLSQESADLLIAGGKTNWFVKRDGLVTAKGKGELQTYFLSQSVIWRRQSMGMTSNAEGRRRSSNGGTNRGNDASQPSSQLMNSVTSERNVNGDAVESGQIPPMTKPSIAPKVTLTKKQQRLVDWNVEMLKTIIRQIVARRNFLKNASHPIHMPFTAIKDLPKIGGMMIQQGTSSMPLDEVVEVIELPEFDVAAYHANTDAKHIKLDPSVESQLRKFVALMATAYQDNPFHNFDHASHVAMSVSKLLSRIVAPDLASINARHDSNEINTSVHLTNDMKDLHDHTYGITSDPLTQLAVVMSALIHDVDHRGIPNNILIQEEPAMALKYRNKSVAEQNSVDIAWEMFMDDSLKGLRDTICPEYTELRRFRQIIVSSVLATDIFDPQLSSARKARWSKAFPPQSDTMIPLARRTSNTAFNAAMPTRTMNPRHDINRKATIVVSEKS